MMENSEKLEYIIYIQNSNAETLKNNVVNNTANKIGDNFPSQNF